MNRLQSWYRAQPKAFRALLTINVVLYVVWVLLLAHIDAVAAFVFDHVALNPTLPGVLFEPWQLVTYNFLHLGAGLRGFLHILFNMLFLYWIGRDHEDLHGPNQLMALYLFTGVGGGLLTVVLHALFPSASFFGGIINGASASVLGIMTAVVAMYPYRKIRLLLIGSVRLLYVVLAFLAFDLLSLSSSNTAVGAHLGGVLFGFLFVKIEQAGIDLTSWAGFFFRKRRPRPARTAAASSSAAAQREGLLGRLEAWLAARSSDKEEETPAGRSSKKQGRSPIARIRALHPTEKDDEPAENEVDRILDKISEQGYDALTEEEKRVLYEASRR